MKKVITITILLVVFTNTSIIPHYSLPKATPLPVHMQKQSNSNGYCVTCVTKSIHFLSRLDKQQYRYIPCDISQQDDHIQLGTAIFSHHTIYACIKKAIITESLKPIIALLRYTQYNVDTESDHFLKELLILIFTVHKQILFNECVQHHYPIKKSTLETIIAINNIINQLPIAEVLSAIEMLVMELPPFIEKYELDSKITWKNWLKKYWWVPPVFGAWFGLKILLKLQRPYYLYSPYYPTPLLEPRPQILIDQPRITTNDPAFTEISNTETNSK